MLQKLGSLAVLPEEEHVVSVMISVRRSYSNWTRGAPAQWPTLIDPRITSQKLSSFASVSFTGCFIIGLPPTP